MTSSASTMERRFCRSTDRSVLGGVCGGFAEYFGFNLKVTRILAVIGFVMNPPLAALAYIAIVLLVPARPTRSAEPRPSRRSRRSRRSCRSRRNRTERREAREEQLRESRARLKERCASLDRRLASLEKVVTSPRYQLDREFENLEHEQKRK